MKLQMTVIGNIGSDAVIKQTNGKSVINFSVAHTEKFTKADGTKVENTTWVECALWDRDNMAQYLKKGTLVEVEGSPSANAYQDKEGQIRGSLRLNAFRVLLLSAGKGSGDQVQGQAALAQIVRAAATSGDDLPF